LEPFIKTRQVHLQRLEREAQDMRRLAEGSAAHIEAIRTSPWWRLGGPVRRLERMLGVDRFAAAHAASAAPVPMPDDTWLRLRSLEEWKSFLASPQGLACAAHGTGSVVRYALAHGVESSFLGPVGAADVRMQGDDPREGLLALGLNARQRAVLEILGGDSRCYEPHTTKLYMHEGLTPFASLIRGSFPFAMGSEYAPDAATRARIWPIPHVDIQASGLPAGSCDFVISNEVLEHVPDQDAALADTARLLKPGGLLLATLPFLHDQEETVIRARLENGEVRHLMEPEYHGNPTDPEAGSLVFQVAGWDLLRRCREAGFSDAWMTFLASHRAGITAHSCGGVLLLQAVR